MTYLIRASNESGSRQKSENQMKIEKRRQAGIAFPAYMDQEHLTIVRLNVEPLSNINNVKAGLSKLCTFFEHIDEGIIKAEEKTYKMEMAWFPLSYFNFSATIGFGRSFFKKLNILSKCPKKLYDMPDYIEGGDYLPYSLQQTDMIVQLGSSNYSVNKMVLQNDCYLHYSHKSYEYYIGSKKLDKRPLSIMNAIAGWANVIDVNTGFQRTDGRNLMGFYDGISNPDRINNNIIWLNGNAEGRDFVDGTYMVFQKIQHDLADWSRLNVSSQEKWVGRSKATGLLLGTLTSENEAKLMSNIHYGNPSIQKYAIMKLTKLTNEQRDPEKSSTILLIQDIIEFPKKLRYHHM